MSVRFTSRRLFGLMSAGCVVAAGAFWHFKITPAFRVDSDGADCWVYLDNRPLGLTPLVVDTHRAKALGLGFIDHHIDPDIQHRSTPFGLFLRQFPRADGSLPLLNVRPQQSEPGRTLRESIEAGDVAFIEHPYRGVGVSGLGEVYRFQCVAPLRGGPRVSQLCKSAVIEKERVTLAIDIPKEVQAYAVANTGGSLLQLNVFSLKSGRQQMQSWRFTTSERSHKLDVRLRKSVADEEFILVASMRGISPRLFAEYPTLHRSCVLATTVAGL